MARRDRDRHNYKVVSDYILGKIRTTLESPGRPGGEARQSIGKPPGGDRSQWNTANQWDTSGQ